MRCTLHVVYKGSMHMRRCGSRYSHPLPHSWLAVGDCREGRRRTPRNTDVPPSQAFPELLLTAVSPTLYQQLPYLVPRLMPKHARG